jgi:hypothetical protein
MVLNLNAWFKPQAFLMRCHFLILSSLTLVLSQKEGTRREFSTPINFASCLKCWTPEVMDSSVNLTFFRSMLDLPRNQSLEKPTVMDCRENFYLFQHLILCIYAYFSVNMWLQTLPDGYNGITQVDYLGYNGIPTNTWITQFSSLMAMNFTIDMNQKPENFHIVNSGGTWLSFYLVHPSDAFQIASHILQADPCRLVGFATDFSLRNIPVVLSEIPENSSVSLDHQSNNATNTLVNSLCNRSQSDSIFPEITILQRKFTRRITNLPNTKQTISKFHQAFISSSRAHGRCVQPRDYISKVVSFEKLSLLQQARIMERTDIFITPHGAAEANSVFMRPCSVVLEIFPYGYQIYSEFYFKSFFQALQILHDSWAVSSYDRRHSSEDCQELILNLTTAAVAAAGNRSHSSSSLSHELAKNHPAAEIFRGRSCLRRQDVTINQTRLWEGLVWAIQARAQCISTHPMYTGRGEQREKNLTKIESMKSGGT